MNIRPAKETEWTELQRLNNEVFIDNAKYDPDIIDDWAYSESGKKYFQELLSDTSSICLVAENELGELVGYIAASPKIFSYRKSKYLEVANMGVIPVYRSQGVGRKLMEECKKWAKQHGFDKLFVNAYSANKQAITFYENNGFTMIDVSLEGSV